MPTFSGLTTSGQKYTIAYDYGSIEDEVVKTLSLSRTAIGLNTQSLVILYAEKLNTRIREMLAKYPNAPVIRYNAFTDGEDRRVQTEFFSWYNSIHPTTNYQVPANTSIITASRPVTTTVPQAITAPIQSLFSTLTTQGVPVPQENNLTPLLVVGALVGLVLLVK